MGKRLNAWLGRTFKAAKFKAKVNLAISRLVVLKNQRQARLRQARSDVLELLQLGHHDRALVRVEYVIKDQNMLDVYDKIEGYCSILIDMIHLIEQERECPEELKEAASGLLYAASRCGDFPEIQDIRATLTSRFGKEFAARAIELRNNCGVHPQMVQKLTTRMPSLESRIKALKQIASENGLVVQLEDESYVSVEEQLNVEKQNQLESKMKEEDPTVLLNRGKAEELSDSVKTRQKYKDVAEAAQAAFESATYAAAAARAAVELSRSESRDPDDHNSPSPKPRSVMEGHDSVKPQLEDHEILHKTHGHEFNKNIDELEKPKDILSSNAAHESLKGATMSVDEEIEANPFKKEIAFDESNNESNNESENQQKINQSSQQISSGCHAGIEVGSGSRQQGLNTESGSTMKSASQLDLMKRPLSVRTR